MADMTKFIILTLAIAVAVAGYLVFVAEEQREIGDPVLSLSPEPGASAEPSLLTDGTYGLLASESWMRWQASRPFVQGYLDSGSVALSAGTVTVTGGRVASGSVTVDLASITATVTGKGSGMDALSTHLKSADFFDTATHPTAAFELSSLSPLSSAGYYRVAGSLTLKGMTQTIAFDAQIQQQGDVLAMTASDVTLDRTRWGLTYGSGTFFGDLVDEKLISDTFTVTFAAASRRTSGGN